jgi:hypothetical protein
MAVAPFIGFLLSLRVYRGGEEGTQTQNGGDCHEDVHLVRRATLLQKTLQKVALKGGGLKIAPFFYLCNVFFHLGKFFCFPAVGASGFVRLAQWAGAFFPL